MRGRDTIRLSSVADKRRSLKRLQKYLSSAPKLEFLLAIYSIQKIQNPRNSAPSFFADLPNEVRTTDRHSEFYFHPWFLETLANELLAAPWEPKKRDGFIRTLNLRSFSAFATAYNLLNRAENASDGPVLRRVGVLSQLNRLAKRQFEWQRRFATVSRMARYHSIYRTDRSRIYFKEKYDIEFDVFTKTAFAIYAMLLKQSTIRTDIESKKIGIDQNDVLKTIGILSVSIEEAHGAVRRLRQGYDHIAYAPSIFRVSPLVTFLQEGVGYVMTPFPDLLFYRITEGLFYDFVDNPDLRNDFSANLESYISDVIEKRAEKYGVSGNITYGRTAEKTPDILVSETNSVIAAIEIKGRRQNATIRFGENPTKDFAEAYEDLSKGVFQLWKYLADSSKGLIPGEFAASEDTILGVCTLDNWIESAFGTEADVCAMAHRKADAHVRGIPPEYRKHVPIFSLSDMEFVLSRSDVETLIDIMRAATTDEYRGWLLASIFSSKFPSRSAVEDALPFGDVNKNVPWWTTLDPDLR
ncbi:MAG: hypothetical protein E5V49_02355 [Mesorhizobium sp.]|nr:hypothetical protein EN848_06750 [bacterium M00.F.Ca.ET.205.01.1.1]TGU53767.1 hypothetical protein EN795_11170 [bacterium M00.F.Ca.ET.152.01.1.1]TGV37265.1 hypothetical protein EN829_011195 [Mesorhizobium sp. M00.F.Ca.ET.186.01.1.1]TGZ39364.1 hypothetical protein EN805_28820 [bacterium M00.F.Ca.ET.162.01.1.1]TIW61231.1 MAG: hypothetical protein E5V48_10115 [Mesorhizobium sp.]